MKIIILNKLRLWMLLFLNFFWLTYSAYSQIITNTNISPYNLVYNLFGKYVDVANIKITGDTSAIGIFDGISSNIGISKGIILATGKISNASGPNDDPINGSPFWIDLLKSTDFSRNGDTDLNVIQGCSACTQDAAILEFEFRPETTPLTFRYVFASEEYPFFVCSQFNDVFAFFLSGPNPWGGNYSKENIAFIPETTVPVAINSVNSGNPGWDPTCPCFFPAEECTSLSYSNFFVNNGDGSTPLINNTVQYNGFTTVFTATMDVIPCETYYIKIAIADVNDGKYDSAVLIEESSFNSNSPRISTSYSNPFVDSSAVEGCNDVQICFSLEKALDEDILLPLNYIGSTADTTGSDFFPLPASVTIPAGQKSICLLLSPYADGIDENTEKLVVNAKTSQCGFSSATIYIKDYKNLSANIITQPNQICNGESANLNISTSGGFASKPFIYNWSNGYSEKSFNVYSNTTTTYTVTVQDVCGYIFSAATVLTVHPKPVFTLSKDTSICMGGTATLKIFDSEIGNIYKWSTFHDTKTINVNPTTTTKYYVSVTSSNLCTDTASVVVSINPVPDVFNVTGGGQYCSGADGLPISLSGSQIGVNYNLLINQVYSGITFPGNGSAINFGNQKTPGNYSIVATYPSTSCSSNMSGSATISVLSLPNVYNITGGGAFCSGSPGVKVGLSGSQIGVSYQLLKDGIIYESPINGSGLSIYFGNKTSPGIYTVIATNTDNSCSHNMNGSATITINPLPAIFNVTGGGAFCEGAAGVTVSLTSSQTGVEYQLLINSINTGNPLQGTGSALNFANLTTAGNYTVRAAYTTTSCSRNMSGSATITVNALPDNYNITGGGAYCSGGTGVPVGISGSQIGVNYQLLKDGANSGTPIPGSGAALSFGNKTSQGTYTVTAKFATTSCSKNMSGSVSVNMSPLPTAFIVSGGGAVCAGGSGLPVNLSGSQTGVNYQLQLNSVNIGSPITGNGSNLSFGNQTLAGTYNVVATNISSLCSNNMAGSATITINQLPTAYSVSGGGAYCTGGAGVPVNLTNSQIGVNYQLLINGIYSGSPIAGTGFPLSFGLQTSIGNYSVFALNPATSCSSYMSGSTFVSINHPLSIINNLKNINACINDNAEFSFLADGTFPRSYAWFKNGVQITGESSDYYKINSLKLSDAGAYFSIISNICGSITTSSAVLTINTPPVASLSPSNVSKCTNDNISFSVSIDGSEPFGYLWYKNGNIIANATSEIYQINSLSQSDNATYWCLVDNICGYSTTNASSVTVNSLPLFSSVPSDVSQCYGTDVAFSVSAIGTPPISFQWFKNNVKIENATSNNFQLSSIKDTDTGAYKCAASNICGTTNATPSMLNVLSPPIVSFHTPDRIKCIRDSVLFKIIIDNLTTPVFYQWAKNNVDIPLATNSSFRISTIIPDDAANYSCRIINSCGNSYASIKLSVNESPFIPDIIPNQTLCEGASAIFYIHPTGPDLTFQWTKGGINITGATTTALALNNLKLSDSDIYSCNVKNSCETKTLSPFLIFVNQKASINISPVTVNKFIGDSISFLLSPTGTPPFSYQWYKNFAVIQGKTDNSFKIKPIQCNDEGIYSCYVANACGNSFAQIGTLDINGCDGVIVSGIVNYDNKNLSPLNDDTKTIVFLKSQEGIKLDSSMTDAAGYFTFFNVPNGTFNIICSSKHKWGGGNPLDALLINRHYVGIYNFANTLRERAADVDLNGKVNPADALAINRRFVSIIPNFKTHDWLSENPTFIVNGNIIYININAICAGDVDGSYFW